MTANREAGTDVRLIGLVVALACPGMMMCAVEPRLALDGVAADVATDVVGDVAPDGATEVAVTESCFNGADDDRDELNDCFDPDCATRTACVPPPPIGWIGPVVLYDGPTATPVACPTELPERRYEGHADLTCDAPTCSDCTCASPEGVSCGSPTMTWSNSTCGGTLIQTAVPDTCLSMGGNGYQGGFVQTQAAPASGGACDATGGVVSTSDATWERAALACGSSSLFAGGCPEGALCAPRATTPFDGGLCVLFEGEEVPCPTSGYTEQRVFFTEFTDERRCTDCGCSTPEDVVCEGTITTFSNTNTSCSGTPLGTHAASPDCTDIVGCCRFVYVPGGTRGGACRAAGGEPAGTCVPKTATTVCCLP